MGVAVSKTSALAPISLASTVIGFISFAFTLATFIRVFWENLTTIFRAGRESRSVLATLRTELEEERASLRELKRHTRSREGPHPSMDIFQGPELDEIGIRNLQGTVRRLTRRFEEIERPFLVDQDELERRKSRRRRRNDATRRGRSRSAKANPYRSGDPYRSRDYDFEKAGETYKTDGYDSDDEQRIEDLYGDVNLSLRFFWLRNRSSAMQLLEAVNRVQTRRIARQVGEIACMMHSYRTVLEEMRHGVALTEDKMNRVVGIRRID